MRRFDDWPERLARFIEERRQCPFVWGEQDCALLACDAVLAMTGVDLAAEFRGQYDDALSAVRAMKRFCAPHWDDEGELTPLEAVADRVAQLHGLMPIPPLYARRGDVVMIEAEHGPTLGFVHLDGWHVIAPGISELLMRPFGEATRAWRI